MKFLTITKMIGLVMLFALVSRAQAMCVDAVVMVHGNTTNPSSWDNTVNGLLSQGYSSSDIFLPDWGNKDCATCNNHSGSEETPVRNALQAAVNQSCTGKIDVIGHSMGVTLAGQQIKKLGIRNQVDAFVGVAGAVRGLLTCGVYPFHVPNSTCGRHGFSVSSPLMTWLYETRFGDRVYSIKSYSDQIICGSGSCLIYGVHSSSIWQENGSYNYNYDHFDIQTFTSAKQIQLIQ